MNPILQAADLLWSWSSEVDAAHAQPGAVEAMRLISTEARAEYSRLSKSPSAQHDALIRAWALRELEALPRGPWRSWIATGSPPAALQLALEELPEAVGALVLEHVADELGECECCRRRAPCRLVSDGSDSGESDWRCAWGCQPPEDPSTDRMLRAWAKECGI